MAYIQGEVRGQQALFPSTLDELIPPDHVCRVIEAFVAKLDVAALGFVRAEPAETGRPGYDPRDLLKLYLYGYLQQVRSSRRWVTRHLHEGALQRMNQRATAKLMRLRRCTVERPFAVLKHVILGNARFLLRGGDGAQIEISLATLAYNLKTMIQVLGGYKLARALAD